ncbi:MAG: hypothetical protein Q8R15_01110 [Candidatus Micrarchaeota archaeon]|nr:hypothetical protein [Candidatus Micrarchaeota archaeon]
MLRKFTAQAVFEAVKGKHYNLLSKKKLLWLDAIDADSLAAVKNAMQNTLAAKTLLIVISKSGNTTETIANFQTVYKKGVNVVVISSSGSPLHNLAISSTFKHLEIPYAAGGRYSVFSNVGLFPLAVMGIDVEKLAKGAKRGALASLSLNWKQNPALVMATLLYLHHKNGKHLHEHFFFANNLESLGKWYRQLLGESIGKELNLQGKTVHEGITPIVATAVDLHSQAQLYFGGKNNRLYSVVEVEKQKGFAISLVKKAADIVPEIRGKQTVEVVSAIASGFKKILAVYKRPFVEIKFSELSEEEIGEYMQVQMVTVILLAHLLNVTPFDQPNVEDYKKETKRQLILVSKHY